MKFSFQNKWIYAECEIFRYYSPNFRLGGGVPAIRDFISQVVKSCKRGMNPFRSLFQASRAIFRSSLLPSRWFSVTGWQVCPYLCWLKGLCNNYLEGGF